MDNIDASNYLMQPQAHDAIEVALKGLSMRSKAISSNIANTNTPGYKAQSVEFESLLQNKIDAGPTTDVLKLKDEIQYDISADEFLSDGSPIDIDMQMIQLAETGMKYKSLAKMSAKHFRLMKTIISGGGG